MVAVSANAEFEPGVPMLTQGLVTGGGFVTALLLVSVPVAALLALVGGVAWTVAVRRHSQRYLDGGAGIVALALVTGRGGRVVPADWAMFLAVVWIFLSLVYHHGTANIPYAGITGVELFGGYLAGRLLIRKSGTEPLIRVMAECEDEGLLAATVAGVVAAVEAEVDGKAAAGALLGRVHAQDDLDQRGFTAATGAHQRHFFAGRQLQIDAPENCLFAVGKVDVP